MVAERGGEIPANHGVAGMRGLLPPTVAEWLSRGRTSALLDPKERAARLQIRPCRLHLAAKDGLSGAISTTRHAL